MTLYIEIDNGVTRNHPAFEENLLQAFGCIPTNWELFIRVERPVLDVYEVLMSDQPTYEKVNDVWMDVWSIRNMTNDEKIAKQQQVITAFNSREQAENWSAWIFDDATCTMQPPIPRPAAIENVLVFWCGADNNWKKAPTSPVDGNQYKFDFFAWQWVQVVN